MTSFVDLCRETSNAYVGFPFIPTLAVAVDLFPDTPHCELVLVFERYKNSVALSKGDVSSEVRPAETELTIE